MNGKVVVNLALGTFCAIGAGMYYAEAVKEANKSKSNWAEAVADAKPDPEEATK